MSMPANALKDLMSAHPLFSLLDEDSARGLSAAARFVTLEAGNLLYRAGAEADGAFLIAAGKLELAPAENPEDTCTIISGELIGDEFLDGLNIRARTARAQTDCACWFFPASQLREAFLGNSRVWKARAVLLRSRELAERVRMSWLEKDEQVHFITRKHPIFLLLSLLLPLVSFGLLVAAAAVFWANRLDLAVPVIIAGFIFALLWLAWNNHNWANDYYIITNQRMVWVEKVSGFYESRQEAPLGMVVSVGVQSTQMGRILGYADVVVRTIIGNVRFSRVEDAEIIEHLVEVFWRRRQSEEAAFEEEKMRAVLRQKISGAGDTHQVQAKEDTSLPIESDLPLREKSFFAWMFGDFLKVRNEIGGVTTYRKHWFILLRKALLPLLVLAGAITLLAAVFTWNFTLLPYNISVFLGALLGVSALLWLIYNYVDWRNDIYRLTPDQVIDIDRKPLGRESKRSAPLDKILAVEYERRGIIPMLLNFGTVYIRVSTEVLTFDNVYQPSKVQEDIFRQMQAAAAASRERDIDEERERVARWFNVYHQQTQAQDPTKRLSPPPL
jgi:hypothetical protein